MSIRAALRDSIRPDIRSVYGDAEAAEDVGVVNADVYLDGEDSTAGTTLTTTILDNMTKAHRPLGAWSITAATPGNLTVVASDAAPLVPVRVGNTDYEDSGTRGIKVLTQTQEHYARFDFSNNVGGGVGYLALTVGAWITPPSASEGQSMDLINVLNGTSSLVINWYSGNGFRVHGGIDGYSAKVSATAGTRYWVTLECNQTGTATIKVYTAAGVLVGTETLAVSSTGRFYAMCFGRIDATGDKDASHVVIDGVVIDVTDATYPLGVSGEDATSAIDGYLVADDFDSSSAIPVGWSDYNDPDWADADGVNLADPDDAWYDLGEVYGNLYFYGEFTPRVKTNYRHLVQFSGPNSYTDIAAIGWLFGGALGFAVGGTGTISEALVVGTKYHVWFEWESGTAMRLCVSTSATKPDYGDASWAVVDTAGVASASPQFVHIYNGGTTDWHKARISDSSIGSDPE